MKETNNSPKDGASRQAKFRAEQRKHGRRRHEYWLTADELQQVTLLLAKLRETD